MNDIGKAPIQKDNHTCPGNTTYPIKKCHYFAGKFFVVIEQSIIEKIRPENDDLYFCQQMTKDGCIIFRPYVLKEIRDKASDLPRVFVKKISDQGDNYDVQ